MAQSNPKPVEDNSSPADEEIQRRLHSLWWQARKRNRGQVSAKTGFVADAELIATCAAFCDLERASDAVTKGFSGDMAKEAAGEGQLAEIVAKQDALVERMIALPCTTLAGVQAMATALAVWDRELLKDTPASHVGEVITANMVERLLALQHLDADLLAVCSDFRASQAAFDGICEAEPEPSDEERDALVVPIAASWDIMLDRMARLQATTSDGLAARALALAQHSGIKAGCSEYAFEFLPGERGGVTGRLLHMLLSDASRMISGPLPVLDAELLALRPEFDQLHALMIDYNTLGLIPDGGTECAVFDALCRRIASMPLAVTPEGRAFQAASAMHDLTYRMHDGDERTDVVWLFLKGIAGDAYQSVEGRK